ncbi:uncharacterized protein PHACADRAFT_253290 [Phanerochaete carnosa HHB-10118-sp]|uniref:Uncharacterized protein n=1 Tax=Phanerochaete carnosa (strain HHB-10118-sp) TaxID=650164 RepID=K5VXF7_PHACS|nr:uncharacterized protein PHACADRAFT_253290 [Phanerochaete carnosa HHB-10118-sp]EKM56258.1 hypothetical protein PHACADRAFT_253290 [Phanerochaete carnosa HHB-10118-sp]
MMHRKHRNSKELSRLTFIPAPSVVVACRHDVSVEICETPSYDTVLCTLTARKTRREQLHCPTTTTVQASDVYIYHALVVPQLPQRQVGKMMRGKRSTFEEMYYFMQIGIFRSHEVLRRVESREHLLTLTSACTVRFTQASDLR